MNTERALIVDDSKTAQHRLKRMLQKFNLEIDTASSAEEALGYLSYNHPAVIFLDQQMQGMNGIEALKTIKANPNTALIPVIMYTAQDDDVFVSQARALGALDIFSKSTMQPSNLERVLSSLNIRTAGEGEESKDIPVIPASVSEAEHDAILAKAAPIPAPTIKDKTNSELDQVRSQIGRLFEIHIADVRNQINNSTQFIVKRLSTTIEKKTIRDISAKEPVAPIVKNVNPVEKRKTSLGFAPVIITAFVLMGLGFGYQLVKIQNSVDTVSRKYQQDTEEKNSNAQFIADSLKQLVKDRKAEPQLVANAALLQAIGMIQNSDFQFNYGEAPLNETQIANLKNLIFILAEGGYKGTLTIDINFGNACLENGSAGVWRLARSDVPASSCKMLKDLNQKFMVSDYITPGFQAFQQSTLPILDGRIGLRLVSSGISIPRAEYPVIRATTTAGDWNNAALRNNRISVQLSN